MLLQAPRRWWRRRRPFGGPSRTSQAVALVRAELDRPSSPEGDPEAQRRLCAGMRQAPATRLRPQLVARTRFFDDQVSSAISAGVRQIVVCGAGYDDRALRFRTRGVRFFELDHPSTQRDKARRLRTMGIDGRVVTLIPADFRTIDVVTALAGAGQRADQPSLFLCEGLLVYLDQATIRSLLAGLAARAAPGSVLAASLAIHPDTADSAAVTAAANARRRAGKREPWRTILPLSAHQALLEQAGWEVASRMDAVEGSPEARPRGSVLVTATPALLV